MDEAAWAARSAREQVILWGLVDWVELERVHDFVAEENTGAPLSVLQDKTLDMIGSIVAEGLFVIGDLTGPGNWTTTAVSDRCGWSGYRKPMVRRGRCAGHMNASRNREYCAQEPVKSGA